MNFKKDFPIFSNNPGMIYLDSGVTAQKPQMVIDGVTDYVTHLNSGIHRGMYRIAEKSEDMYEESKGKIAKYLGCHKSEIIYGSNANHLLNLIAQSVVFSDRLGKGDKVLIGIQDHHASIVPFQLLAQKFGFEIDFISQTDDRDFDFEDFEKKYTPNVKAVVCSQVSNVTGAIYDIKKLGTKLRDDTIFIVDGSQAMPHFPTNVVENRIDAYIFTGHKMMSYGGIGAMYLKKSLIKELNPMSGGGGTVDEVTTCSVKMAGNNEKFEAGVQNVIGAVSLMKAFEYIESIGGYEKWREAEEELIEYTINKFNQNKNIVKLIGPQNTKNRIGVFSFLASDESKKPPFIAEYLGTKDICIRAGGLCAHPLIHSLNLKGTCRISLFIYTEKSDIDKFFEVLNLLLS